jgi:HAD superfamily hydrolase (TIGR01490 family)
VSSPVRPFGVAAFDLDGTLVDGHSMPRFAGALTGPIGASTAVACALVRSLPRPDVATVKRCYWHRLLHDRPAAEVRAVGERVARDLVDHLLRPDVVERLERHRAGGDELVLVTAALDVYARPFARELELDHVIATEVVVEGDRCTGELRDADLKDERKVEALRRWLGPRESAARVHAYGNSEDDEELLRYAEVTRRRSGQASERAEPATEPSTA